MSPAPEVRLRRPSDQGFLRYGSVTPGYRLATPLALWKGAGHVDGPVYDAVALAAVRRMVWNSAPSGDDVQRIAARVRDPQTRIDIKALLESRQEDPDQR